MSPAQPLGKPTPAGDGPLAGVGKQVERVDIRRMIAGDNDFSGTVTRHPGGGWHADIHAVAYELEVVVHGIVTAGGRVLSVSGTGASIEQARTRAYDAVGAISWPGAQYRRDIAASRFTERRA